MLTWNEVANQWEGEALTAADAHLLVSRYSELPDPSRVEVGTVAVVHDDPNPALNGLHVAYDRQYWRGV